MHACIGPELSNTQHDAFLQLLLCIRLLPSRAGPERLRDSSDSFNQSAEHSSFTPSASGIRRGPQRPRRWGGRGPRDYRGERRIDAAIDHLAPYGFAKPQIRKIINNLLKLYGKDGWPFLEEGSYRVVLDELLEEQAQEDQKQEAAAAEEASPPQNGMEVAQVHCEAPDESRSALELQASPKLECVLPLPPAGPPRARPPCHGWISEESGTESEPEDGEILSDVARPVIFPKKNISNPVETLPSKRKRPSRWAP